MEGLRYPPNKTLSRYKLVSLGLSLTMLVLGTYEMILETRFAFQREMVLPFCLCARQGALTWRCKFSTDLDDGNR